LLVNAGISECRLGDDQKLGKLRQMYEPYVAALSARLMMPVGGWMTETKRLDNWKTTAWATISGDGGSERE
jgi:hypothetical protein